jgi:HAD superfamily hydrolase (TIGR01484 family)
VTPEFRIPPALARRWVGVFTDIDDTLTEHGRLDPAAFRALADLRSHGLRVVPVTGRPWGWADLIARQWPVDGVVAENGGLWCWVDEAGRMHTGWLQDAATRAANRARLDDAASRILERVPGTALASDQPFRALDLAIDWCEAVPRLDPQRVTAVVDAFRALGASCKVSSIHVNGWFGDFDKRVGCAAFVRDRWGEELAPANWTFVGDSANDEPMFARHPDSFGVANVSDFLSTMRSRPRFVAAARGGAGFAEIASAILAARR